jgi:hypothetical protein
METPKIDHKQSQQQLLQLLQQHMRPLLPLLLGAHSFLPRALQRPCTLLTPCWLLLSAQFLHPAAAVCFCNILRGRVIG